MLARVLAYTLYGASLAAAVASALIVLSQFITWLQQDTWHRYSLLRLALDWNLIPSYWPRAPHLADVVFNVLQVVPVSAALLAVSPLLWWCAKHVEPR